MKSIVIPYFSGSGHTARMAQAVHDGAASVGGARVTLLPILGADISEGRFENTALFEAIDAADAVIFGSPTYMGGPAAQFKAFADPSGGHWYRQAWAGKVAGGFTVSGHLSGDKLNTLQYFQILASQHGMIWVGIDLIGYGDPEGRNRLGSQSGAMGIAGQEPPEESPNAADLATGRYLGERVARIALKLRA